MPAGAQTGVDTTGWAVGWAIAGAVILVAALLLLAVLRIALQIRADAGTIRRTLHAAQERSRFLWEAGHTRALARVIARRGPAVAGPATRPRRTS